MNTVARIHIKFELAEAQTVALAQFVKRIGYSDIRALSADSYEADLMRDAIDRLRAALAREGYAPR